MTIKKVEKKDFTEHRTDTSTEEGMNEAAGELFVSNFQANYMIQELISVRTACSIEIKMRAIEFHIKQMVVLSLGSDEEIGYEILAKRVTEDVNKLINCHRGILKKRLKENKEKQN